MQNASIDELRAALHARELEILQLKDDVRRMESLNPKSDVTSISALKESEERYHKMVEEVEDYAILLLDENGIIRNWNKGAQKIKGYSEKEVVGKHFGIFYPSKDQAAHLPERLISQAKTTGKAIHEGWRVRKDGSYFWGSIVITALHDDAGNIIAFSKVTRDLSERKFAEDKLHSYNKQLEIQNGRLQQFAYAAAHDMKEPLRKIQFYISAIRDKSNVPEKAEMYLTNCANAAKRMQALIEDILSFAKVSEHSLTLERVDLATVWKDATNFYQETIDELGATIQSVELPVVSGILFQLRQLFYNLLSNSLKYRHPDRAPRISIECEKVSAQPPGLDTALPSTFFKISVHDNGIGFDPSSQEKIFELFERLHTRDAYSGTGIGLAMCKKIVENHGGFIEATGNPGVGAIFDIFLPA